MNNLDILASLGEEPEEELADYEVAKKLGLFDIFGALSYTKKDVMGENPENWKQYNSFMINRAFSYHPDTIYDAFIMSCAKIPDEMKYYYYLYDIPKRKRFGKWGKKQEVDSIEYVMQYYGWSKREAEINMSHLSSDMVSSIVEHMKPKN